MVGDHCAHYTRHGRPEPRPAETGSEAPQATAGRRPYAAARRHFGARCDLARHEGRGGRRLCFVEYLRPFWKVKESRRAPPTGWERENQGRSVRPPTTANGMRTFWHQITERVY